MKYTTLILFVLPISLAKGANGYVDSTKTCRGNSYIGIVVMPDLVRERTTDEFDVSNYRSSYSVGFNYNYILGTHWGFHGGVLYADKGLSLAGNISLIDPSAVESGTFHDHIHDYYMDIPLGADYYFGKRHFHYYVSGSVIPSLFVSNTDIIKTSGKTSPSFQSGTYHDNEEFNKIILGASLGGGCIFPVSKKIFCSAGVLYQSSFTQFYNNNLVLPSPKPNYYLYSIGLELGVRMRI